MLYFVGIGFREDDVSVRGLEVIKSCDYVYLDNYTSIGCDVKKLEKFYGKKIILADRNLVEGTDEIVSRAEKSKVCFLVFGDIFSATTHVDLLMRAKKVEFIHGPSILTAVGVTGLSLYKFGAVVSIPFDLKVKSPVDVFKKNFKNGLHTLFLLDLDPSGGKFLSISEACKYLVSNKVSKDSLAVGCVRLGFKDFEIKVGKLKELVKFKSSKFPQCLIVPGKMHFMEEDVLREFWKKNK